MKISQKIKKKTGKVYRSIPIKLNASKPKILCPSVMRNLLMSLSLMEIFKYFLENISLLINKLLKDLKKPRISCSKIHLLDLLDLLIYLHLPSRLSEEKKQKSKKKRKNNLFIKFKKFLIKIIFYISLFNLKIFFIIISNFLL